MAGSSLLALIDDIATILDDVSVMTKVAAKKTAGVLGDDLALNAQQVTGVSADRELSVIWAVAKGSALNKIILIPVALLISQFLPWLVTPLLMLGGVFLCFEGFEKIFEKVFHGEISPEEKTQTESEKIKGAIRTDFILSAEIIVITLGTVSATALTNQVLVLCSISALMTVGVYGLVAGIVKMDDLGLWLTARGGIQRTVGFVLLQAAPRLMSFLGIAGTIAMFLVGGGILTHGIPLLHAFQQQLSGPLAMGVDLGIGLLAGAAALGAVKLAKKVY